MNKQNSAMTNGELSQRYMKSKQAADYLAISERSLWTLTKEGQIPASRRGLRFIRYDIHDLDAFMESLKGVKSF